MEFAVPEGYMDEALDLLDIYRNDRIALELLHEFYGFLPDAKNDLIKEIRMVARKQGVFLLLAVTREKEYLYLVSSEGIEFQGTIYNGEHEAIVDTAIWQKVRDILRRNGVTGGKGVRNKHGALLKGLLYCACCGTSMGHTYTSRKPKIYRYYVCLNAQKYGWDSCPTKSINAHEIETAVIEHIRAIGSSQAVIAETVAKVREDSQRRLAELESDQRVVQRDLKKLNTKVKKLVSESFAIESNQILATDQLADLHDQIRTMEQRMRVIQKEIATIEKEDVDENELARALTGFSPVWDCLPHREQARIMRLLIERVGLDGQDGKVTVTFRSAGIKALCTEARLMGNKDFI